MITVKLLNSNTEWLNNHARMYLVRLAAQNLTVKTQRNNVNVTLLRWKIMHVIYTCNLNQYKFVPTREYTTLGTRTLKLGQNWEWGRQIERTVKNKIIPCLGGTIAWAKHVPNWIKEDKAKMAFGAKGPSFKIGSL